MRLAIICGGRASADIKHNSKPLKYIGNSIGKVKSTLEANNWLCKENWIAKDVKIDGLDNFLLSLKAILTDKKVDEFLFYYTGHGKYGNSKSQVDFQLRLESEQVTIGQLVESINLAFGDNSPSKMGLVIDSCYSGEVVTEQKPYRDIEILTSTDNSTKSYEKIGLIKSNPNYGISVFSYYFCNTFETTQSTNEICLKIIGKHVKNCQLEQEPYYNDVQIKERIVIGYNKEINEIYKILNRKYPIDKDFKKAILSYIKNDSFNFKEIQDLEDEKQLFQKLLEERECLYCLLYELNLHLKYAHRVNKVEDCKTYGEEIAKTRTIQGIVLVIQKGTNSKITDCSVSCHQEKSDGTYNLNFASLPKIDFSMGGNHEKEIGVMLSDILKNVSLSDDILELKLILPEELFSVDFFNIKVKTIFNEKNILEVFNISKKILMRFTQYKEDGYFERWDNNQKRFNTLKSKSMEKQVLLLDEREKIPYFGKTLTQGEIKNKEKKKYLAVHSHYSLMEAEHIISMVEWGVPIVLSAKDDEPFEVCWEECMVSDMKLVVSNHIHYNKNRFFIHDNYDEVVTLQEAIEKDIQEKKELRK